MRNKLTRLSASVVVLAVTLSTGAACARNILPDAFNDRYLPASYEINTIRDTRVSPVDENISTSGYYSREYRIAERLMSLAIKAKNKGDLDGACRLANEAAGVVSRSYSLRDSAMERDYTAFADEVCVSAGKA